MIAEVACIALMIGLLIAGVFNPGYLFAGCFFTYQAGSVAGLPWLGMAYVIAATVIALGRYAAAPVPARMITLDVAMLVLICYLFFSLLWSPFSAEAMPTALQLLVSVLSMYAIARFSAGDPSALVRDLCIGLSVGGIVVSLSMLASRITETAHENTRLYISNTEASTVGLSMALPYAMCAAVVMMCQARRLSLILLGAVALAVVGYCSVATGTRAIFLAFGAGALVALLLIVKYMPAVRSVGNLFIGIAGLAVAFAIIPQQSLDGLIRRFTGGATGQIGQDSSSQDRLKLFADGMEIFGNYPMFGAGYGSFSHFSGPYPHNIEIEMLAAGGIVGLVLFLFWVGALFICQLRLYQKYPINAALLLGLTITALVQLQVSYSFFMARPLLLLSALTAALATGHFDRIVTRRAAPR